MNALPDFSALRVIVVGDAMLDVYIHGQTTRDMPEAPKPVVLIERREAGLGGAANAAANIASLGAQVDFICLTGRDEGRAQLIDLAKAAGLRPEGFIEDESRPTIAKERIIANGDYIARLDREKTHDVSGLARDALLRHFDQCLASAHAVVLSDYCKGALTDDLVPVLIEKAGEKNIPVFVDSKKKNLSVFKGAFAVKPNRTELAALTGMKTETPAQSEAAARHLMAQSGIANIIASRSEEGVMLVTKDQMHQYRATARKVAEVSGVGDTLIAATVLAHTGGLSLADAVRIGNIAAGLAVEKPGTVTISNKELSQAVIEWDKESTAA